MSSFRHVLVTTFFVILNLMADTGLGISGIRLILEKLIYYNKKYVLKKLVDIIYKFVSTINNDPYKLLLLGWL